VVNEGQHEALADLSSVGIIESGVKEDSTNVSLEYISQYLQRGKLRGIYFIGCVVVVLEPPPNFYECIFGLFGIDHNKLIKPPI